MTTPADVPGTTHSPRAHPTGAEEHIPALDGLRGLAILLVMIFHQTVLLPRCEFDRIWQQVVSYGWSGVDLFFVLSGFLITGILVRMKSRERYFRNFYARRTLRIFPLYYAVVFFCLVIIPHLGSWLGTVPAVARVVDPAMIQNKLDLFGRVEGQEFWYWLYLSNIPIAIRGFQHSILDISWSLAIEEQFYLLWPTAVFFLNRRNLMRLCFAMIGFAIAVRCAMIFAFDSAWYATYVSTPCRWDSLAVGALLSLWISRPGGIGAATGAARRGLVVFGSITIIAIIIDQVRNVQTSVGLEGASLGVAMRSFGFTSLAFCFAALLVFALTAPRNSVLGRVFQNRAMRVLGTYSYALYLFHLPVRALIRDLVFKPAQFPLVGGSAVPAQLAFHAVSILATLALALVSWHLLEKPFLNLKRFFPSAPAVSMPTNPRP